MDLIIDAALSDPWNRILIALAPLVLPLPFIAILNQILKALGFKTSIVALAEAAIRPALREPEQARVAAAWAIVTAYCFFVVAAPSVDVFFPERGIPWSGFSIGLAASAAAAVALFKLVPMLKIASPSNKGYRYVWSLGVMAFASSLLALGLVIEPPERIEVLLAITADPATVTKLEREIGTFEDQAGGRVHARYLNRDDVTSFQKAREALAVEGGDLIIFGSIEQVSNGDGPPKLVLSLNIEDKWGAIPTKEEPFDFPIQKCASNEDIDAERNAAIEVSSVAVFGLAFVDIERAGPERALETLALAYDVSQRTCGDTADTTRALADLAYDHLLAANPRLELRTAYQARMDDPDVMPDPYFWRGWAQLLLRFGEPGAALTALENACYLDQEYRSVLEQLPVVADLADEEAADCSATEAS